MEGNGIGLRAVNCDGWAWVSGMRATGKLASVGGKVWSGMITSWNGAPCVITRRFLKKGTAEAIFFEGDDVVPDMSDPGTCGHVLALIRKAWGDPGATTISLSTDEGFIWFVDGSDGVLGSSDSEGAALVEALECAPHA